MSCHFTPSVGKKREMNNIQIYSVIYGEALTVFFLYFTAFKSQKRESNVHVTLTKVKLTFKIVILNVLKCSSDKISRWSGEH